MKQKKQPKNKRMGKSAARRFNVGVFFARIILGGLIRRKYGLKLQKIVLPKGPKIIMCNHVTTLGPFTVMMSIREPIHGMVAKDFIPLKYRKLIDFFFSPIWKDKSLHDSGLVMECFRYLKAGENVFFFPEGNRTFSTHLCYIPPATAKMVARSKATIVYLNLRGGITVDPRFGLENRKGHMEFGIRAIRTPEEIAKMSEAEVLEDIKKNLSVEDVPSPWPSISDKRAEKLERVLYRCPTCGALSKIRSEGNLVKCDSCGLEVTYGEFLTFENPNQEGFKHKDLYSWYSEQEEYVRAFKPAPGQTIYSDSHVTLSDIALDRKSIPLATDVEMKLTPEALSFGDISLPLGEVFEMACTGKQSLLFYHDKKTYNVSSSVVGFNALKYLQMFYHLRNLHEGVNDDFLGI